MLAGMSQAAPPASAPPTSPPLAATMLLAYSAPMVAVNFSLVLFMSYVNKYAIDVLLVPAAAMGLIFGLGRLWDAVTAWTEFPDVFELQQPKTKAIERRIADTFKPYLEARDWVSINRGVEVGFTDDGFEIVGAADRDRSADRRGS